MNHKFVFESFEEFLKFQNDTDLNEANGSNKPTLDKKGIEEFFAKLLEYNYLLSKEKTEKDIQGYPDLAEYKKAISNYSNPQGNSFSPPKVALAEAAQSLIKYTKGDLGEIASTLGITLEEGKSYTTSEKKKIVEDFVISKLNDISDAEATKSFEDFQTKYGDMLGREWNSKSSQYSANYGYKYIAIWGLLSENEKNQIYTEMLELALKRGYTSKEQLLKVAENAYQKRLGKSTSMYNPGFKAFLKSDKIGEVEKSVPKGKKKTTLLLETEESSGLFKPNMFGANGENDYLEGTFKKLIRNLSSVFFRSLTGEIKVTKINVYTSSDRYRNTRDSEGLTWGELSYARAVSMTKLIESTAKSVGLPDEIVSRMNEMISLYYRGNNNDGTSGPNPPEGTKFGYYIKDGNKSKWVEGENRNEVVSIEIGEQGEPLAESSDEAKITKISTLKNKKDYNEYRYNLIEIEYEEYQTEEGPMAIVTQDVFETSYPILVSLPSRFADREITIPIPSISTSSGSIGGNSKPGQCPKFGEKTSVSMGLSIKQLNLAKWQKDIAK